MANSGSLSIWSMLNALPRICYFPEELNQEENRAISPPPPPPPPSPSARGFPMIIPPPTFTPPTEINLTDEEEAQFLCNSFHSSYLTPLEKEMCLQSMFNLMTNSSQHDDVAQSMISKLDRRQLKRMASLLTSDSHYFFEIASNRNGSKRIRKLLGKSDDIDSFFADVILRCFPHVMTDKQASYVAIKGIRVFEKHNKEPMYGHILHHAIHLARDKHGCIALNAIITDLDNRYYRRLLLDTVVFNALFLSNDAYGNFVVQHVLKQCDLLCTHNIAFNLQGHCVELSFKKYGSYIVEKLLEKEQSMVVVVIDLLECEGDRLMRLARNDYGNFVVSKALRVTQEMYKFDLFRRLVKKLMPFRYLLRRSPEGNNISAILESVFLY